MQVELVPGYGVYVSKMKLDTAADSSQEQPTRLVRELLSVNLSLALYYASWFVSNTSEIYFGRICDYEASQFPKNSTGGCH